jgi:hypothetical protein
VRDEGSHQTLQRLEGTVVVKSLRIIFSPNWDTTSQAEYLKSKGQVWSSRLEGSTALRGEAWYSLQNMIMKSVK